MKRLRRLLDSLSVYLPLIVMAMLALGSWWLVKSVPALSAPAANKPTRQEPDYSLSDFSVKSFNASGRLTREISGAQAQHYPASELLEIQRVRIFVQSKDGTRMNAQASQGISTDDGKQVTLVGSVDVIQHAHAERPQLALSGERLVVFPDEDRLVSAQPVRITRGRDVFTAQSMDFNSSSGEYALKGRVRGTLMPKP